MKPGKIVLTPTPVPRRSSARLNANPRRPNLVAEYSDEPGLATFPAIEEMKTRCPSPRSTIGGASARASWIGARRFTSSARSI
jgi:hypothetical protein